MATPEYNFNWPMADGGALPYVNGVQVVFSPWDFQLLFSQLSGMIVGDTPDQTNQESRMISRLIMSPQHAKAFLQLLANNISTYEQNFGEIPDLLSVDGSGLEIQDGGEST